MTASHSHNASKSSNSPSPLIASITHSKIHSPLTSIKSCWPSNIKLITVSKNINSSFPSLPATANINWVRLFYNLAIGDFIKLGRVELVVLEINNAKKTQSVDFEVMYGAREYIFHMKEELEGSCKICLTDEATE